ncbi:unnamed protein product [Boreogadus saida]
MVYKRRRILCSTNLISVADEPVSDIRSVTYIHWVLNPKDCEAERARRTWPHVLQQYKQSQQPAKITPCWIPLGDLELG